MEETALDPADAIAVDAIAYLVIPVGDCHEAVGFYARLFGLIGAEGDDLLPGCGHHRTLRLPSGQWLVLTEQHPPVDEAERALLQPYRIGMARREAIRSRLAGRGIEAVDTKSGSFDFRDLDGNPLRLILSRESNLPAFDLASLVFPRALELRRDDTDLALCLTDSIVSQSSHRALVGAPRIALATSRIALDGAVARLDDRKIPFLGPVLHPDSAPIEASLYFGPDDGPFIELSVLRGAKP